MPLERGQASSCLRGSNDAICCNRQTSTKPHWFWEQLHMNCSWEAAERKPKSCFRMAAPQYTDACLRKAPSAGSAMIWTKLIQNKRSSVRVNSVLLCAARTPFWSQLLHTSFSRTQHIHPCQVKVKLCPNRWAEKKKGGGGHTSIPKLNSLLLACAAHLSYPTKMQIH